MHKAKHQTTRRTKLRTKGPGKLIGEPGDLEHCAKIIRHYGISISFMGDLCTIKPGSLLLKIDMT